jgi:hypothetical protein
LTACILRTYYKCFDLVEEVWGPHTIDCFANYYNTKTRRFFSSHCSPGCTGMDFFVQSITGENCFVVPPICLIARTLHYLQIHKEKETVIVQFWPSSYFWPVTSRHLSSFIVKYKVLNGKEALTHGKNTNCLLGLERFCGKMLALRVNFS